MSDLLVYVVIAVVAIAGAAAWLYFPKREGEPTPPPRLTRSLPAQRKSRPDRARWRLLTSGGRITSAISAAAGSGSGTQEGAK
jgi:hypothetical protein